MSKRSIKSRAQELLTIGRRLAETPGLTRVEANNAVYGPGGAVRAAVPECPGSRRLFQDGRKWPTRCVDRRPSGTAGWPATAGI